MNSIVYLNGELVHAHDAHISPFDAGFQFGAGLFETILCLNGRPHVLAMHLARLRNSASATGISINESDDEIADVIGRVLSKNSLDASAARLKIIVTPGDISSYQPIRRSTMLIAAEPYLRPVPSMPWRLCMDGRRQSGTILAHKSTSYFGFRLSLHAARELGYDDMILLDSEGNAAETTIASLLLLYRGKWVVPESRDALPGITQSLLVHILEEQGQRLSSRAVPAERLLDSAILICNSLIGPFPVHSINRKVLRQVPAEMLSSLRSAWLEAGFAEPGDDPPISTMR